MCGPFLCFLAPSLQRSPRWLVHNSDVPDTSPLDIFNPSEEPKPSRSDARTQKLENKPRKKRNKVVITLVSIVAVLLVGIAGTVAAYFLILQKNFNDGVTKIDAGEVFPDEKDRPVVSVTGAQNILLLGSDTRGEFGDDLEGGQGQRSDTMMIVHIPANRESVQIMSIMRDNWVDIPGYGMAKINAAMATGGVPRVIQTVEGIIDARIDHVAIIDFEGFKGLTDALGGVTIDNPRAFSSKGTSFAQGEITLNGKDALNFVRTRYAFADGDYSRVRNQQLFLKGVMNQLMSKDTLLNPGKISDSVSAIAKYMKVDPDLDVNYILGLGISMKDLRPSDVTFFTSPTLGTGTAGGQSIVRPDWDELKIVAEHFKNDTLDSYTPKKQ